MFYCAFCAQNEQVLLVRPSHQKINCLDYNADPFQFVLELRLFNIMYSILLLCIGFLVYSIIFFGMRHRTQLAKTVYSILCIKLVLIVFAYFAFFYQSNNCHYRNRISNHFFTPK